MHLYPSEDNLHIYLILIFSRQHALSSGGEGSKRKGKEVEDKGEEGGDEERKKG